MSGPHSGQGEKKTRQEKKEETLSYPTSYKPASNSFWLRRYKRLKFNSAYFTEKTPKKRLCHLKRVNALQIGKIRYRQSLNVLNVFLTNISHGRTLIRFQPRCSYFRNNFE